MVFRSYLYFFLKNYIRSHRYLREIILILVFNIFFSGFLYSDAPDDMIWTVFGVLALLLNMITVPSVFYLEKGNSLNFSLVHQFGRRWTFISKILLMVLIDFFWLSLFSIIYGLRFLNLQYFTILPLRLVLFLVLMFLSILIISLSYSYRPWIAWLLLLLIIFGGILNKGALFPLESVSEFYIIFSLFLPPLLEIILGTATLEFDIWRTLFILLAFIQIAVYYFLNLKFIMKKDFI